jgi:hypothetical protein
MIFAASVFTGPIQAASILAAGRKASGTTRTPFLAPLAPEGTKGRGAGGEGFERTFTSRRFPSRHRAAGAVPLRRQGRLAPGRQPKRCACVVRAGRPRSEVRAVRGERVRSGLPPNPSGRPKGLRYHTYFSKPAPKIDRDPMTSCAASPHPPKRYNLFIRVFGKNRHMHGTTP